MVDADKSTRGTTSIDEGVVEKLVRATVRAVPGVVTKPGSFGRGYPRIDVQLSPDKKSVSLETFISVRWPAPTTMIAQKVQETVANALRLYAHLSVTRHTVVASDAEPGPRLSAAQIADFDCQPFHRPVATKPKFERPISPRLLHPAAAALRPIRVTGTWEKALHGVHTTHDWKQALFPVTVAPEQPLADIHVTNNWKDALRPVTVAPEQPLADIHVTAGWSRGLRPITVAPQPRLRAVDTQAGRHLALNRIQVARTRLRHIDPKDYERRRPLAPISVNPTPLRPIDYASVKDRVIHTTPITVPQQQRTTPITVAARRTLRPIRTEAKRLHRINPAEYDRPLKLVPVRVDNTPLRPITIERTPLRPIEVRPEPGRLKAITRREVAVRSIPAPRRGGVAGAGQVELPPPSHLKQSKEARNG